MRNGHWSHGIGTVNASRTDTKWTQNRQWTHAEWTMNSHKPTLNAKWNYWIRNAIIEYKTHISVHDRYTWIYHIPTTHSQASGTAVSVRMTLRKAIRLSQKKHGECLTYCCKLSQPGLYAYDIQKLSHVSALSHWLLRRILPCSLGRGKLNICGIHVQRDKRKRGYRRRVLWCCVQIQELHWTATIH